MQDTTKINLQDLFYMKTITRSDYDRLNVPNHARSWKRQFDGAIKIQNAYYNDNIVLLIQFQFL
jgi:hypothetical protein